MLRVEIESDRAVTIDAIGVLEANTPVEVTAEAMSLFQTMHGVPFIGANFPDFIKVTTVVEAPTD